MVLSDKALHKNVLSEAQAQRLASLYSTGEKEILREMNRLLLKGMGDSYSYAWQKTVLNRVREIRGQLLSGSKTWIQEAVPASYIDGIKWADKDPLAGTQIIVGFGKIHEQAVQALADNAYSRLVSVDAVVGRQVDDIASEIAQKNALGSVIGYKTTAQAARDIARDLKEHGITAFTAKNGVEWDLSRYSKMLAQETTNQSFRTGTANRFLEHGHDLVRISEHESSCDLCAEFQGQTFSLSGQDEEFPPLAEAEEGGLFHVGCLHVLSLAPEEKDRFIGVLQGEQGEEARQEEIDRLAAAYGASQVD